ncbi:hypothetical protein BA195_13855 [Tenacibaculum soleae]|uniref:ATPase AAA-type core domain-containing protein n=1 Tax=Tenacibaculum soleae TaxID=447689 RepID=A0A1B9XYR0_9FLAO|nr:AAA family ATPase [Tenacibaculum soleae]OCK42695.1 hypothetical protein BA195_13855 [Tenacibaculum soleae]
MHLKSIQIKNFKGFKNLSFECNQNFNVVIGENNIGKSTIFEALLIWESCFKRIINAKRTNFYKADGGNTYIPFGDLTFIRLINDTDLFFEAPNQARITVNIKDKENVFALTFELSKPKSISNSYLRFKTINHKEFEKFASFLKHKQIKLDEAIFIYQTKPVSNILNKEPFMNSGQVLKKISIGKSGEVLRNKIIKKKATNRTNLENQISKVLNQKINFYCTNEKRFQKDEYIDLKVSNGTKNLDIHLQGSGFLQVAEIFSTIDYLENAMNILLIDEPDSHIHAKLQKKLLQELRLINNTQTFVISHNDTFVSELNPDELFYLNNESKNEGAIKRLDLKNFDKIKKELGGIIVALDKLNYTHKVCFVEGDDDIEYINRLLKKHLKIEPENKPKKEVVFYHLRGKDFLLKKIDHNKRLLSQLFKDKSYAVIYDKDFSTENSCNDFNQEISRKLGNNSNVYTHNGYCIESTIFSDLEKLCEFLSNWSGISKLRVHFFIEEFFSNINFDFSTHTSKYYKDFEIKFNGQKKESRPELNTVNYNDFLANALEAGNSHYLFNKSLISDFYKCFKNHFSTIDSDLLSKTSEDLSSELFNSYIENISKSRDFIDCSKELLKVLYEID